MRGDPYTHRSGFYAFIGYAVWALPAFAFDAVTLAGIFLGALAVGVFGLVRALVRPSVRVEVAEARKRMEEGQRGER